MTNAWVLLYDELNMTDNYEHTPDYYDQDRNRDPKEWESIVVELTPLLNLLMVLFGIKKQMI